jgi:phage terminase small subunit
MKNYMYCMTTYNQPSCHGLPQGLRHVMPRSNTLTDRERRFVDEYLKCLNVTGAFLKAGYSPKSAHSNASRLMAKDSIRAEIERREAVLRVRHTKTVDDLIREYTRLAFTGMSRFMRIDSNGEPVIDLSECTKEDLDLLAEVTVESYMEGRGEDAKRVKKIKIKPYDRFHALDKLAMHLGMFKEKGPGDTDDRLARLIKELQERGSALPVRVTGPLGSKPKPWKN